MNKEAFYNGYMCKQANSALQKAREKALDVPDYLTKFYGTDTYSPMRQGDAIDPVKHLRDVHWGNSSKRLDSVLSDMLKDKPFWKDKRKIENLEVGIRGVNEDRRLERKYEEYIKRQRDKTRRKALKSPTLGDYPASFGEEHKDMA